MAYENKIKLNNKIAFYNIVKEGTTCNVIIVGNMPTLGFRHVSIRNEDNIEDVIKNLCNDERYVNEGFSCIGMDMCGLNETLAECGIKLTEEDMMLLSEYCPS